MQVKSSLICLFKIMFSFHPIMTAVSCSLSRLQLVQNPAACLLTGACKRERTSSVLEGLGLLLRIHWSSYKLPNGLTPTHPSELLQPQLSQLRSADRWFVPRTRLKSTELKFLQLQPPNFGIVCFCTLSRPTHRLLLNSFLNFFSPLAFILD